MDPNEQRDHKSDDRYKWLALISVAVGTFMSTLDASVVNIALPTIAADFSIDLPTAQWIVMSYLLMITSVLLTLGRLGDMFGRKRLYIIGVGVFVLGSLFCATAVSSAALILARAGQGLGAAMMMAIGPAIITDSFPPRLRGQALGLMGSVVAVGLTLGPVVGGYIVAVASWRWIFLINLPIGIIGLILLGLVFREIVVRTEDKFDLPGAFLLLLSLLSLLLALTHGEEWQWCSPVVISMFFSFLVFGTAFLRWEAANPNPVFHLELLQNRTFAVASAAAWISYVAIFAVSLYMSFYLQRVLLLSPVETGHILLAFPLTVAVIAPVAGWLSDRIGCRLPASMGLGIAAVGLALVSRLGADSTPLDALWRTVVVGIGSGAFQSPNSSSIMGSVPRTMLGVASGTVAMMRNLGMVSGVAIIGAVMASAQASYLNLHPGAAIEAFVYGLRWGFGVASAIAFIGMIISALREPSVLDRR